MQTQNRHRVVAQPSAKASIPTRLERAGGICDPRRVGLLEGRRQWTAAHRRRVLVRWVRRTANRAPQPDPIARRRQPLLCDRAAAVRSELLEIAAVLERAQCPDPASIAVLHELLANGCDSPLYNPEIHVSELRATLYDVRTWDSSPTPDTAAAPSTGVPQQRVGYSAPRPPRSRRRRVTAARRRSRPRAVRAWWRRRSAR